MTSDISKRLANSIFANPDKLELITLVTIDRSSRNEYGELVEGQEKHRSVEGVTAPITGRERETLPEGLRAEDVRTFWLKENVTVLVNSDSDYILYGGSKWRVVQANNWGAFFEVVTTLQK